MNTYRTQTIQQHFVSQKNYLLSLIKFMNWYHSQNPTESEYLKLKSEIDRVRKEVISIEDLSKFEKQQKVRYRVLIEESSLNFE